MRTASDVGAIQLPLYGRIAAGLPIEALRDTTSHIEVPLALLGPGEHYGLEVAGDVGGLVSGESYVLEKRRRIVRAQHLIDLARLGHTRPPA